MRYINITHPDINNGLGVRVTLWIAGCSHHCPGCHNEWTWNYNQGNDLWEAKDDIYEELSRDYIKGLTLSGGDPLSQSEEDLHELYNFLKEVKLMFPEKDIWIYAGDRIEEIKENATKFAILCLCDYLVDGTFHIKEKDLSLAFRGSKNQRIWKKGEDGEFKEISNEL